MAETTKLNEHDEGSSDMHDEPAFSGRERDRHSVQTPSTETGAQSVEDDGSAQPDEPARDPHFEAHDDDGISEFAESVVSGLAQAGLDIEADEHLEPQPEDPQETSEAFFTGWGGPGHEQLGEIPAEPEHESPGNQTLSEIGLASAAMMASGYNGAVENVSSKHDELADAVQSALLSVYGEPPAGAHSLDMELPQQLEGPGAGWNAGSVPSGEDGLSPQDVILNYFSYDPNAQNGAASAPGSFKNGSDYESELAEALAASQEQHARSGQGYYQGQRQPQWEATGPQRAPYEAQAAFPASVGAHVPLKTAGAPERQSGRLMGAAAFGLVSGIAIAATLAVYVINSNNSGLRVAPGSENQNLDDPGYGHTIGDAAPRAEALGEVVASDAVATAGQPAPLAISVKSQHSPEQMLVSITGIPEGARLNAGIDAGGGNWLLLPRRLNGLSINLPAGTPNTIPLEVQLLDSNVRTALSQKTQFTIRVNPARPEPMADSGGDSAGLSDAALALLKPARSAPPPPASSFDTQTVPSASAPQTPSLDSSFQTQIVNAPPQQPAAPPFQASLVPANPPATQSPGDTQDRAARKAAPKPEIEDLIREGNKRMREGDILEARQFYQKAVMLGEPEAALAMGRSYDPIYFARIERKNAEPDAAKAFEWYRKAMDAGATQTAMVRIENLKHFLNE